jgi:hypothetical protein
MIALVFALWLSFAPAPVSAQSTPNFLEQCTGQINDRLGLQQRLYRRVLFGMTEAQDAELGSTRYTSDGVPWMKVSDNSWKSQAEGYAGISKNDDDIDRDIERDFLDPSDANTFRAGLFSTKGVLTSELIPAATQSFRALQCRTAAVCEAERLIMNGSAVKNDTLTIKIPGCRDIEVQAMPLCRAEDNDGALALTPTYAAGAYNYCQSVSKAMVNHEAALLKFSVAYDAAYRTLLQFTGTFDDFLTIFQGDLLSPIRQAQTLLQQLGRIPCFLSMCNE